MPSTGREKLTDTEKAGERQSEYLSASYHSGVPLVIDWGIFSAILCWCVTCRARRTISTVCEDIWTRSTQSTLQLGPYRHPSCLNTCRPSDLCVNRGRVKISIRAFQRGRGRPQFRACTCVNNKNHKAPWWSCCIRAPDVPIILPLIRAHYDHDLDWNGFPLLTKRLL